MPVQKIVGRKAVIALKKQVAAATWSTPTAASDAIKVRSPEISWDPQMVQTDEVSASLGQASQLVGGMKVGLKFGFYLKGSGVPNVLPEISSLLEICGLTPTTTGTDITGTDIAAVVATGTDKFTATTSNLAPLTAGTHINVAGFVNAANNGEFLVESATVGTVQDEIVVTKVDGSAVTLVAESAGPTVTITRGIAGVAATAGTAATFTAQSPWAGTLQLYRNMPVLISGNPATPAYAQILDYTAGRVATLFNTYSPVLSTSSIVSIPAHTMFGFASTGLPWASASFWMDGRRYQLIDAVGESLSLTCTAAGVWSGEVQCRAILYADPTDEALPTPTYDATRPGIWRASTFLLDRAATSLGTLSVTVQNTVTYPPNPNETEGFDAPIITGRKVTGSIDPHMTLAATRDNVVQLRAGGSHNLHATLKGGLASTPGTRVGIGLPDVTYTGVSYADDGGLKKEMTNFECEGLADNEFGLFFR